MIKHNCLTEYVNVKKTTDFLIFIIIASGCYRNKSSVLELDSALNHYEDLPLASKS